MTSPNEKFGQLASRPEQSADTPELRELPQEIRNLFRELPPTIQEKIFPKGQEREKRSETVYIGNRNLEEVCAGLDERARERFFQDSLAQLFSEGGLFHVFKRIPTAELSNKVAEFMDILWDNRTKPARETIRVFGTDAYKEEERALLENEKHRAILLQAVAEHKKTVDAQQDRIEVTKHQKRLTAQKQAELLPLSAALEEATEALKRFDMVFETGKKARLRMSRREEMASKCTETLKVVMAYLTSDEFATAVSEQLDTVFYLQKRIVNSSDDTNRKAPPHLVANAKETITVLQNAIANWHSRHQGEENLKARHELTLSTKQVKTTEYFKSLRESYLRGKNERHSSDDELVVEISNMRVALNLLIGLAKKQEAQTN